MSFHLSFDMQNSQRVYPLISRRFVYRSILGLLFTLGLFLIVEFVARMPLVQARVPMQAYGSNNIQFDYQIDYLNKFVRHYGAPECFIIGNSMTLRGINPQILNDEVERMTGKKLICYSFSITGSPLTAEAKFTAVLVKKYHPKLIIIGTNFLDYTKKREMADDTRFIDNPWVQYQSGNFSLDGWLVENSYAYRIVKLISYGAYRGFDYSQINHDIDKWQDSLSEYGYGYSDGVNVVEEKADQEEIKTLIHKFGDFSQSTKSYKALQEIVKLVKEGHIRLVIVRTPYHPSLIDWTDDNGKPLAQVEQAQSFIQKVDKKFTQLHKSNEFVYLEFTDNSLLGGGVWLDRYHLNHWGGEIYTTWLADQLVREGIVTQMDDLSMVK
jgi:RNase H-fold protein (predicted Holliday junction resolvase)